MDAEGAVWAARWGNNRVVRVLPNGTVDMEIVIPGARNITCCVFGGGCERHALSRCVETHSSDALIPPLQGMTCKIYSSPAHNASTYLNSNRNTLKGETFSESGSRGSKVWRGSNSAHREVAHHRVRNLLPAYISGNSSSQNDFMLDLPGGR